MEPLYEKQTTTASVKPTSNKSDGKKDPNGIANKFKRKKKQSINGMSITQLSSSSSIPSSSSSHNHHQSVATDTGKPSHHTMSSLALLALNNPTAMDELTRTSMDMRSQRELDRLQKTIQQKESQFMSALEIADNLNISNTKLKNQCASLEEQLGNLQSENQMLQSQYAILEDRYEKDMQQLQVSLDEHSQMVIQLQQDLMDKEKALQVLEQQQMTQLKDKYENGETFTRFDSGVSDDTTQKKTQELKKQLQEEKKRTEDWITERKQLYDKLEEMSRLNVSYEKLQEKFQQYERSKKEEIAQYVEASKSISKEVVILAAQNSRLEQRMEELQLELEQRSHEIELLSQANVIQTRQLKHGTMTSDQMHTGDLDNLSGLTQFGSDNTFMLTQIDDSLVDDIGEEENEQEGQNEGISKNNTGNVPNEPTKPEPTKPKETKKMNEKDKEEFVADVIKEYLHLSASSVKIKYPLVTTISNEALIEQSRHMPFYQYHDVMVRIMEKEMKRIEEARKKLQEVEQRQRGRSQIEPVMAKAPSRRSLLGNFFGLFKDEDGDEEKEFRQAKPLAEGDQKLSAKGHVKSRSSGHIAIPATNEESNLTTKKAQPENSKSELTKQNSSNGLETAKPKVPMMKDEPSANIEQILNDMDLDGILDDEDGPTNSASPKSSRAATKKPPTRQRSRSTDRQEDNHAQPEDSHQRRIGRNALTRVLSRR